MNKLILVMLILISTTAISAGDTYKQTIRLTQRDFEIANEVCQDHGGVSSITPEIVRVTDLHYTVLQLYIDCVENFSYKKYLNEIRR